MRNFCLHIILLLWSANAFAVNIDQSSATALNTVTLYADSTFVEEAGSEYKEGAYFRILSESYYEHPDADQKQKFKWFKVETADKKTGWIYGDGLAVFVPYEDLDAILRPFHRKKVSLGNGFEKAVAWVGAINGRDNFYEQDYMNPLYNEYYLIVTNQRGNSVLMKCSGESVRGETLIQEIQQHDITGDGFPEFIVQRRTINVGSAMDEREVEIYTVKAGTLSSVFHEHLTLSYESDVPSPALYKMLEVGDRSIRISYVDYVLHKNYSQQHNLTPLYPKKERCMEYVTAYYSWDKRTKTFKNLYGESRMEVSGSLWSSSFSLKETPRFSSKTASIVKSGEPLTIIKHYEEYAVEGGKKVIKNWFYIKTAQGKYGYLPANKVGLQNVEHADILNRYYLNPPISKSDYKASGVEFMSFQLK